MTKATLPLFCMLIILTNHLVSQSSADFSGLPVNGSARTAALAAASVGEAYDVTSMYWNPAALSFLRQSSVTGSSILDRRSQSFENSLSLPPLYKDTYQVIAAGIACSFYGEKWSQPYFAYNGIDLGYSIKVHRSFSIGILMNVRYGNTSRSGLWALSGIIGGFYSPSSGSSYGIVVDGLGDNILYTNDGNEAIIKYQRNAGQSIRIGSSFRFPSIYRMPYITITLESQKLLANSRIIYRGGFEIYPFHNVSMRFGILSKSLATVGTFGVGINLNQFHIDYAFSPDPDVHRFHLISISYLLEFNV